MCGGANGNGGQRPLMGGVAQQPGFNPRPFGSNPGIMSVGDRPAFSADPNMGGVQAKPADFYAGAPTGPQGVQTLAGGQGGYNSMPGAWQSAATSPNNLINPGTGQPFGYAPNNFTGQMGPRAMQNYNGMANMSRVHGVGENGQAPMSGLQQAQLGAAQQLTPQANPYSALPGMVNSADGQKFANDQVAQIQSRLANPGTYDPNNPFNSGLSPQAQTGLQNQLSQYQAWLLDHKA